MLKLSHSLSHSFFLPHMSNPVGIYLLKVNNRKTRARCEICPKLTIKTRCEITPCSSVSTVNVEHIIADWEGFRKDHVYSN